MLPIQSDIRILDKLLALSCNVSLWSARRKMTLEDMGGAELPPEDLASLGSKRIADRETLKARAVNYLDRYGVRFMYGWAIGRIRGYGRHDEKRTLVKNYSYPVAEPGQGGHFFHLRAHPPPGAGGGGAFGGQALGRRNALAGHHFHAVEPYGPGTTGAYGRHAYAAMAAQRLCGQQLGHASCV